MMIKFNQFSKILKDLFNNDNPFFRYGGGDFALIIQASTEDIETIAEQLRLAVLNDQSIHNLCSYLPLLFILGLPITLGTQKIQKYWYQKVRKL